MFPPFLHLLNTISFCNLFSILVFCHPASCFDYCYCCPMRLGSLSFSASSKKKRRYDPSTQSYEIFIDRRALGSSVVYTAFDVMLVSCRIKLRCGHFLSNLVCVHTNTYILTVFTFTRSTLFRPWKNIFVAGELVSSLITENHCKM